MTLSFANHFCSMKMPKYDFYSLQIWMQNEDDQQILVEISIAASSTLYVLSFMLILRTNVTFYILLIRLWGFVLHYPSSVRKYSLVWICKHLSEEIVWGSRLWRAEQAPVWKLNWYWLELFALKIFIIRHYQYWIPRWIFVEQQSYLYR